MELSEKDFKQTIIKILQQALMVTCETNEKNRVSTLEHVKKNKNFRIENKMTQIKCSSYGLKSRMEMIEERLGKIGD